MSRVLITGATGFVGRNLAASLASRGYKVTGVSRTNPRDAGSLNFDLRIINDIGSPMDWGPILEGIEFVVHLAARVHVMKENESDPLAAFRRVNVDGTKQLLMHDGMSSVKRFIFVSTVKVHGESTRDRPFRATDRLAPADAYSQSKFEAELLIQELARDIGVETTIIRPPLIYGPGVRGNFVRLMRMIDRGIPLPIASLHNSRSLLGVDNLCALIHECLVNPGASGESFLASDNSDMSTYELAKLIARSMNRPLRFLPIPVSLIAVAARLIGRSAEASRFAGSLQVDIKRTMESLSWVPPVSTAAGIQSTVDWYLEHKENG